MNTTVQPIRARRMGHYTRPSDFHRPLPLITLGPPLPNAACKGQGNLWDADADGETEQQRHHRHHQAQAVCAACPERDKCLQARINQPELGPGVFGGHLFNGETARWCACGCGKQLPTNAHTHRLYLTKQCRMRVYLAQPDKKAADLQRRRINDRKRTARRKAVAA